MPKTMMYSAGVTEKDESKIPTKMPLVLCNIFSDVLIVKKLIPWPDSTLLQLVVNVLKAAWHRGVVKAKGW
jgi:hypothetical protein